MGNHKRTVI